MQESLNCENSFVVQQKHEGKQHRDYTQNQMREWSRSGYTRSHESRTGADNLTLRGEPVLHYIGKHINRIMQHQQTSSWNCAQLKEYKNRLISITLHFICIDTTETCNESSSSPDIPTTPYSHLLRAACFLQHLLSVST